MVKSAGVNLFIRGNKDQNLYVDFQENRQQKINQREIESCPINAKKTHILIAYSADSLKVSVHDEDSQDFIVCVEKKVPLGSLQQIYPILYAQSLSKSKFRAKIDQFVFHSDAENNSLNINPLGIENSFPKLFNQISMLKSLKQSVEGGKNYLQDDKLDITKIYQEQDQVWNIINLSNELIGECVSETEMIESY